MLIEFTEARSLSIGSLYLIPGINKVEDDVWDNLTKSAQWKNPIKGLIASGRLVVVDSREKVTQELVAKTYDVNLLEEWNEKAKGPLKGAIKKQLKALEIEENM